MRISAGLVRFCGVLGALAAFAGVWAQEFTLTILHTNDLHSHAEPSQVSGRSVGGYARQATALLELREESVNPILLNAGDTFQGTLYYTVYKGLADLAFMNLVGYDAMALGNHEFDDGVGPIADFARLAKFPVLAANMDFSAEPSLQGRILPSTVLEVAGERVGIVGSMTPDLFDISSPGPTVKMKNYVPAIQQEVDSLIRQGVNKIILLSHCGYSFDRATARELRGIDVVVGGHSHTLLGELDVPGVAEGRGPYPTVEKDREGQDVLIVQGWEWGKAVGKLEVTFDARGQILRHSGGPVLIDERFSEDPYVASLMEAFRKPIEALATQPIAELATNLSQRFSNSEGEGLMGSVIADAVLSATVAQGAEIAFWNAGGVRAPLSAGTVTYGQLIEVCPFGNTLVVLDVTGEELWKALEHGAMGGGMLLPSRGFSYTMNPSSAEGSRVVSASLNGVPLDRAKTYRVTFNSFTASGGDGHAVLRDAPGRRVETGFVDIDALIEYFKANSPVTMENEGRIKTGR